MLTLAPTRRTIAAFLIALVSSFVLAQDFPSDSPRDTTPPPPSADLAAEEDFKKYSSVEGLQVRINELTEKRQGLHSEAAYIKSKIKWIENQLADEAAPLTAADRDKAEQDLRLWRDRLSATEEELNKVTEEQEAMFEALREAVDVETYTAPVLPESVLELNVAEDETFNGRYQVRSGGYILLPRLPRIFVAGKTVQEAEEVIRQELKAQQILDNATVQLEVIEGPKPTAKPKETTIVMQPVEKAVARTRDHVLYFSGEVTPSGAWIIPDGFSPTLLKAILRQNLSPDADLTRVRVLRLVEGHGLIEEVDVQSIMDGRSTTADFQLLADDIVIIPRRGEGENILYFSGEFQAPGTWDIPPGFKPTISTTLLRVQLTPDADLENVRVVRMVEGRAMLEEINVVKILDGTGLVADFELQAKDIITVPAKATAENILYLSGQVQAPGTWEIPKGFQPSIATVLLRTQLTEFADLSRVRVLRLVNGRGVAKLIDVQKILDGGGLTPDFKLMPNDIVTVPAAGTGDTKQRTVYIRGEVGDPGAHELPVDPTEHMTPYMAILLAGGPTQNADLENAELVRLENGRTIRRKVDILAIMNGEASDVTLDHKDVLIVPGKFRTKRIYLTGKVMQPGIMEIAPDENSTLYASIVHRGGFSRFANLSKVYVLRDTGDGMRERIPVDVKALKQGFIPDLVLEHNDIVVVPEKFFSWGSD
jgi:protein involved in polysaccharide export with SLBB domain